MRSKEKVTLQPGRWSSALRPGDVLQVVAPASPVRRSALRNGAAWLKRRGYRVRWSPGIFSREDYLAGSDQRRLREFLRAWRNPHVRGIIGARGGYGAMRLWPQLSQIGSGGSGKVLMGLSDLTVLLNFVSRETGWITVHGPMIAGHSFENMPESDRQRLFSSLENATPQLLTSPNDFRVLMRGEAKGRLWGGNLAMVTATLATKLEIPFKNALLFLEEVREPRYRVDRMFAQLSLAGKLEQIRALLLGEFLEISGRRHNRDWLTKLIRRYLPRRRIPVLYGLRSGHGQNKLWLPIGGVCNVSEGGKRLHLSPLVKPREKK